MKIDNKILQERYKWTLSQKIDHSLLVIEKFFEKYPESVVSFSGGLDSTVVLYLTRMVRPNTLAVFVNTTNEFTDIIKFVKQTENVKILTPKLNFKEVIEKYGFPLVSKLVTRQIYTIKHPTKNNKRTRKLYLKGKIKTYKLSKKWYKLLNMPFDVTNKCCDILKKRPLKKVSENGTFIGTMAIDSTLRKIAYLETGCISVSKKRCYPIGFWTKEDIWDFIKLYNIKYSKIYDKGEHHTGCAYCAFGLQFDKTRFERLKKLEPKRYKIIMAIKNKGITYEKAIEKTFAKSNKDQIIRTKFPIK